MVIKSKIYDFLKKNLGEYLYGFEKNQLDVGLLSGHIELVNVNFRPDKVNELLGSLGFPVQIKAGLIGKLKFKCHYTSFLSSPMEVEIDELLLVFGPITHISREQKRLQEMDDDTFMWQFEMEQQILYYNKFKQKNNQVTDFNQNDFENPKKSKKSKHKKHENNGEEAKEDEIIERKHRKHRKKHYEIPSEEENHHKKQSEEENTKKKGKTSSKVEEIDISEYKTSEFKYESNNHTRKNTRENRENHENSHIEEEPKKKGFLEKYFTKVLKNLTLTIKSVHIRFEDETYPYLHPYALGMSFSKLEIKNSATEWAIQGNKYIKRQPKKNSTVKEIIINEVAVYIYSMASIVIPTSLWEATINSEIGIFEAFPAYEVREMIIQQSEMLSAQNPSTVIEPTHGKMCITLNDEAPNMKMVGVIEKVECKFTSAMAECMRNFFDYCTNVQIWPLISRHRPSERIPERPEKREHRKERRKRREIVRNWFQYAFTFVKFKRAAIHYIRERKKDRENLRKIENQEKIREKILKNKEKINNQRVEVVNNNEQQKGGIFGISKQRKVPGSSNVKLDEIVKDYNSSKKPPVKLVKRPYDGEKYFPKNLENSEIEMHLSHFSLLILDEDTNLSLEFTTSNLVFAANTLLDEMAGLFTLADFAVSLKDNTKTLEIVNSTRKKSQSSLENAFKLKFSYRPAEVLIPNDIYACFNMYEIKCEVSNLNVVYMHNTLNHFFLIKESFALDKCFRENLNLEFIKSLNACLKKNKSPKVFGVELKRLALAKKIAKSLIEFQKNLEKKIFDLNQWIVPILFNCCIEIEGGKVNFHDFSPSPLLFVEFPLMKLEAGKSKEGSFLSGLGVSIKSEASPAAVYDFVTTLANIFIEKLKQIRLCTNFKKIS